MRHWKINIQQVERCSLFRLFSFSRFHPTTIMDVAYLIGALRAEKILEVCGILRLREGLWDTMQTTRRGAVWPHVTFFFIKSVFFSYPGFLTQLRSTYPPSLKHKLIRPSPISAAFSIKINILLFHPCAQSFMITRYKSPALVQFESTGFLRALSSPLPRAIQSLCNRKLWSLPSRK